MLKDTSVNVKDVITFGLVIIFLYPVLNVKLVLGMWKRKMPYKDKKKLKEIIEQLKPFPKDLSKYHVDHIKPLCSFDLTKPEEIKRAFAPENHRWLLIEENLNKSSKDRQKSLRLRQNKGKYRNF